VSGTTSSCPPSTTCRLSEWLSGISRASIGAEHRHERDRCLDQSLDQHGNAVKCRIGARANPEPPNRPQTFRMLENAFHYLDQVSPHVRRPPAAQT
jgi:hypothetical protein